MQLNQLTVKRAVNDEMANTQPSENVSLKGPEDWETWNTQFESKAISTDIWRLISPDRDQEDTEPFAEKPIPLKIGDYNKKLIQETWSQSSQSAATAQGSQQAIVHIEEVDYANKPRTATEMTTAARQAFQLDWTLYQHNFKMYTAEREAIDKLRNWVLKTTNKHLIRTVYNPKDTLKGWYTKLKEQVSVSATKQKRDAQTLYKAANKPLTKAPRDVIAWLNSWEEAVTLAKEKKVPEAQHLDIWFEDFSLVIRGFMKEWIVLYKMLHTTEIENRILTFWKLANDLRKELLKSSMSNAGQVIAKGAFGPSFADLDNTEQPKEDKQEKTKGKDKSKQKMTTEESSVKCPACELQGHTLPNCLYVFSEKAKGRFHICKDWQEEMNKKLDKDNQLQKEVDRIKDKKQKEGETNQDQDWLVQRVGTTRVSFCCIKEVALSINNYLLKNSAILDSGTTLYIFNQISRFLNFRAALESNFV
jgi:hypothetical protein